MENVLPNFENKVVYVLFDGGAPYARVAVQNPRFELQGGEIFLVGLGLLSKGWGSDVPIAIAWSKVQWYALFESADTFYEAEAHYKRTHTRLGFWHRMQRKGSLF